MRWTSASSVDAALARREPQRRYPILLTLLSQSAADVLDEVIQLFDQAISSRESHARYKMIDDLPERAKSGEDRQELLDDLLTIVTDAAIRDEEIGALIRGERMGWERLEAALATATPRPPANLPSTACAVSRVDGSWPARWRCSQPGTTLVACPRRWGLCRTTGFAWSSPAATRHSRRKRRWR